MLVLLLNSFVGVGASVCIGVGVCIGVRVVVAVGSGVDIGVAAFFLQKFTHYKLFHNYVTDQESL